MGSGGLGGGCPEGLLASGELGALEGPGGCPSRTQDTSRDFSLSLEKGGDAEWKEGRRKDPKTREHSADREERFAPGFIAQFWL